METRKINLETKDGLKYLTKMEESICVQEVFNGNECDNFIKMKQQKINSHLNVDIQWIISSFFVIFLLSVWDISDIYQYFRIPNETNMNFIVKNNPSYQNFLNELKNYNENMLISKDGSSDKFVSLSDLKQDPRFSGKISILSDYYSKYDGHFYQHFFSHKNNQQFIKREVGSSFDKQYRTTTTIKALCVLKINSQFFGELMKFCFTLLILIKIDTIEQFIKWNSRSYLKYFRLKHEKRPILNL